MNLLPSTQRALVPLLRKRLLLPSGRRPLVPFLLPFLLVPLLFASSAFGMGGARWAVKSVALPSVFSLGDSAHCEAEEGCDAYLVSVTNVGASAAGVPVVIRDRVPAGVTIVGLETLAPLPDLHRLSFGGECSFAASLLTCRYEAESEVPTGAVLGYRLEVLVSGGAGSVVSNNVEVEGGGAPSVRGR